LSDPAAQQSITTLRHRHLQQDAQPTARLTTSPVLHAHDHPPIASTEVQLMNIASKILVASLVVALAACGKSTQESVDKAAHDRAADVAKARQDAQPAVDAANRDLAKAQQDGSAKVADAHADANREVNKAAVKQSKEQAKADYDV
jgi:hypothetical protein